MATPELLIAFAKLALLALGAYAFGRMLLQLADALAGWPEDPA